MTSANAPSGRPDHPAGLDAASSELLAVLLERVQRVTERVAALHGRVSDPGPELAASVAAVVDARSTTNTSACAEPVLDVGSGALSEIAAEVQRLGWLFGVCAAGFDADTLVERIERDGLGDVLAWASDAARRSGRELVFLGVGELRLAAPTRVAPRFAFALALAAVSAAWARPRGAATRMEVVVESAHASVRFDAGLDAALAARCAALGGAFVRGDGTSEWKLPANWLAWVARPTRPTEHHAPDPWTRVVEPGAQWGSRTIARAQNSAAVDAPTNAPVAPPTSAWNAY